MASSGRVVHRTVLLLLIGLLVGCQAALYTVWDKLGREKRSLLQAEILQVKTLDLKTAELLARLYASSEAENVRLVSAAADGDTFRQFQSMAQDLDEQIQKTRQVAIGLFRDWEKEIAKIKTPELRNQSHLHLQKTRSGYSRLNAAMTLVESKMPLLIDGLEKKLTPPAPTSFSGALDSKASKDLAGRVRNMLSDLKAVAQEADQFLETLG